MNRFIINAVICMVGNQFHFENDAMVYYSTLLVIRGVLQLCYSTIRIKEERQLRATVTIFATVVHCSHLVFFPDGPPPCLN